MRTLLFIVILLEAISCFADTTTDPRLGAWRGSLEYVRPDGKVSPIYFGFNLNVESDEAGDHLSGVVNAYQVDLETAISNIELPGKDVVKFNFQFKNQQARFLGAVSNNQLVGTIESVQGERHIQLERVHPQFDTEKLRSLAGFYKFEGGSGLVIAPSAWTLNVYDLRDNSMRMYFPRNDQEFFSGPGYLRPAPQESRLEIIEKAGQFELKLYDGEHTLIARPDPDIILESVQFDSGDVKLAGLIVKPRQPELSVPGVVVTWGSGRQDRFGYSGLPFYRAVWLAKHGYAALTFDKRGVGQSGGSYEDRTTALMAQDSAAAADFLSRDSSVDKDRVGLLVHSQSGIYAPQTIRKSGKIKFAAVIAASMVNGTLQEIIRTEQTVRIDGYPEVDVSDAVALQILKFYYADNRVGWDAYVAAYHRVKDKEWFESVIGSTIDRDRHSWDFWKEGNSYEPYVDWGKTDIPVFMLIPRNDPINAVDKNLEALKIAYAGDRASLLTLKIYENHNHGLFEDSEGGVFAESNIQTISNFMQDIDDWLRTIEY